MLLGDLKTAWGGKKVNNFLSQKLFTFFGVLFFVLLNFPLFWAPKPPHNYPQNPGPLRKNSGQILAKPGGLEGFWGGVSRPKILDKFWKSTEFLSRKKFWKDPWGGCPEKKFCENSVIFYRIFVQKKFCDKYRIFFAAFLQ